jgi:hypothetical protein
MCDYQINYVNHGSFKSAGGRKKGSPVRIFTNLPLEKVELPEGEGYRDGKFELSRHIFFQKIK